MIIRGFLKTTLLDYPGHVAATIFVGGCNMRCVFCHNMDIVDAQYNTSNAAYEYSCDEVMSHLYKRRKILDGVCITGGEPTLYADLPDFIKKIRSLGLSVKLDTNGTNPEMLKYLINENMIDYVAMDIKASYDKYDIICGISCDLEKIKESVKILLSLNPISKKQPVIDYEFRTTITNEYHDIEEIKKIGQMINGADKYFLQSFTDSDFVPDRALTAPDTETLKKYVEILKKYVKTVEIRGVD